MAVFVQRDINLVRPETERGQPFPVNSGQEAAMLRHVFQFFTGQRHFGQPGNRFFQSPQKLVRIRCLVPVFEAEGSQSIRKQLDIGV